MPKLSLYNFGSLGVNVDTDPVHGEDGQLTKAQNAIRDPLGKDGALSNRPGLVALNGIAAAGSIVGGIGVPLTKVSTHTLYLAQDSGTFADGWDRSTDGFATKTHITSNPGKVRGTSKLYDIAGLSVYNIFTGAACCVFGNRLYYAGDTYTRGTNAPPIRVWDGTVDMELSRVPANQAVGAPANAIVTMLTANGTIYFTTLDYTSSKGRVFQLDPNTGALVQLGSAFTEIPYALEWHAGRLWCGTLNTVAAGTISFIRPGIDTDWTSDHVFASYQNVCALKTFNGSLFVGVTGDGLTHAAVVFARDALGAYSTSETASTNANGNNGYIALTVFGTNLYATEWDFLTTLLIRKFNGTSWTTAYTGSGNTVTPFGQYLIDNSTLFVATTGPVTSNTRKGMLSTLDGTSWTDRSATLSGDDQSGGFAAVTS